MDVARNLKVWMGGGTRAIQKILRSMEVEVDHEGAMKQ